MLDVNHVRMRAAARVPATYSLTECLIRLTRSRLNQSSTHRANLWVLRDGSCRSAEARDAEVLHAGDHAAARGSCTG